MYYLAEVVPLYDHVIRWYVGSYDLYCYECVYCYNTNQVIKLEEKKINTCECRKSKLRESDYLLLTHLDGIEKKYLSYCDNCDCLVVPTTTYWYPVHIYYSWPQIYEFGIVKE